jgi:hypothetical protein
VKGTITADRIVARSIDGLDLVWAEIDTLKSLYSRDHASDDASRSGDFTDGLASGIPTFDGTNDAFIIPQAAQFISDMLAKGQAFFEKNVTFLADIFIKGRITFNNDTVGIAVIPKWSKSVDVTFDRAYETPPGVTITLRLTSKDDSEFLSEGASAAVANVTTTGFTIVLDMPAPREFEYQWVALGVDNPKRTVGSSYFGDDLIVPTPTPHMVTVTNSESTVVTTSTPVPTPVPTIVATPAPVMIEPDLENGTGTSSGTVRTDQGEASASGAMSSSDQSVDRRSLEGWVGGGLELIPQ